jgi:predicted nuclease of predicted toxin-antitoxin system
MQFLVDESAGTAVVDYLRAAGHNVIADAEVMLQAADQDILARATSDGRILVTNDKGFGKLIFRSGQAHHGVVLLRFRDEGPANRVRIVKSVLTLHEDRLAAHFTVATEGSVRIRPARLPRE